MKSWTRRKIINLGLVTAVLKFIKHIRLMGRRFLVCLLLVTIVAGCATLSHQEKGKKKPQNYYPKALNERVSLSVQERKKIAHIAQTCIGKSHLSVGKKAFRADCSGAVRAIFAKANIGLGGVIKNGRENDVKAIYRYAQKYGQILKSDPVPGDLVFFHNTYDRSRNGHMNDALTHVGIVEKVEGTTINFIHHLGESIIRSKMDLSKPKETLDSQTKKRVNHILRKAQGRHRAYTAAELFAGFGRL
jgi:hypothetical protein